MSHLASNLSETCFLPLEVMLDIFCLLDAATILACRSTCHYWRDKLSSYEFLLEVSKRWLVRGTQLFAHFRYSITEELSVDWILKMDAVTGESFPFQFPFTLSHEGWYHVIGVQNGLFCIRFSEDGGASSIITWNPATGQVRQIEDPLQHHCTDCAYYYALAYFPASVDYAVLHISGHHQDNVNPTLQMYTSFSGEWDFQVPCPAFVRMLDATYVAINGVVYWLTFGGYGEEEDPPYIVSFSCLDCTFNHILLPLQAASHCQALLVRQGQLCIAANNHDQETFRTDIWELNEVDGYPTWTALYMYEGVGLAYRPFLIIDDDEIQIMERHIRVLGIEEINLTHFHITRYNVGSQDRQSFQWIEYDEDVNLRSLFHYSETAFPP